MARKRNIGYRNGVYCKGIGYSKGVDTGTVGCSKSVSKYGLLEQYNYLGKLDILRNILCSVQKPILKKYIRTIFLYVSGGERGPP